MIILISHVGFTFFFFFWSIRSLRARKKTGGEKMPVHMIGDILATELSHMQAYISFCSCQLNAASLLQHRTDQEPEFKDFLKVHDS